MVDVELMKHIFYFLWALKPLKPNYLGNGKTNHLGKRWNQTKPFNQNFKPNHLAQTNKKLNYIKLNKLLR